MAEPVQQAALDAQWVEITVRVNPQDVDSVSDVLHEVASGGVVVEPAIDVSDDADFAYEELDAPSLVKAYVPAPFAEVERRSLRRRLNALALSSDLPPLAYAEVEPDDWAEEWKRFYHVQHIGSRLVVRPSWEPYEAAPWEVVIDLDPGAAFGTGQHETTRLCLLALDRAFSARPRGIEVLDLGCGSGILAIAAARLGAARVRALDIDPDAVEVTRENAARNGLAMRVVAACGSLGRLWPWHDTPRGATDLLVANISSTVVVSQMPALAAALRPGGRLIASGFIERHAPDVRAAAEAQGLHILEEHAEGDWRCLVAVRAAGV